MTGSKSGQGEVYPGEDHDDAGNAIEDSAGLFTEEVYGLADNQQGWYGAKTEAEHDETSPEQSRSVILCLHGCAGSR